MTIIIQAVEEGGRSVGRNFPAIEFAGKKSPDLAFSNVDRYAAATASKLLPRLFQFSFSHVTVWSLYSPLVFTLLLLPRYKTFVTF